MPKKQKEAVRVLGIIAEYNPFHNGHLYQLKEAKRRFGCDYVIVVMSGNFVQRGEPALLDKYTRAGFALAGGADVVLELPVAVCTGSAPYFACGAIGLLNGLGIVDGVSFGCETDDLASLWQVANILAMEPESFQIQLQKLLKSGMNFPSARQQALNAYLGNSFLSDLLASPNNILAIEYLKALSLFSSKMEPIPILRQGENHHSCILPNRQADPGSSKQFASASAIRTTIYNTMHSYSRSDSDKSTSFAPLKHYVPSFVYQHITSPHFCPVRQEDFSDMLCYAMKAGSLTRYQDVSLELENRLERLLHEPWDFSLIETKRLCKGYTAARLHRALSHILLSITCEHMKMLSRLSYAPYAHLLGLRASSSHILRQVSENGHLPLVTKIADAKRKLSQKAWSFLNQDITAAELYNQVVYTRYGKRIESDYFHPPVIYRE